MYIYKLRQASQKITKIYDEALSDIDIEITQYSALKNVEELINSNINQLSEIMKLDRLTLTRNLNKLQNINLISY